MVPTEFKVDGKLSFSISSFFFFFFARGISPRFSVIAVKLEWCMTSEKGVKKALKYVKSHLGALDNINGTRSSQASFPGQKMSKDHSPLKSNFSPRYHIYLSYELANMQDIPPGVARELTLK